jgi:FlaA1/EpsC-like NDP-sugar epimerase
MTKTNPIQGKNVLVTGAAGTVGQVLVRRLTQMGAKEIICVDINETEVFFLEETYRGHEGFHAFTADIRDLPRLQRLTEGIDIVFHGAALKHVTICERSPFDAVRTNIEGVENVISAALANDVERVIFMSSDKAVNPTNVLGTSKLMGERLITAANSLKRHQRTIFTSTRFGNVLGSRGSVLPVFARQIARGESVTLTSPLMTRFVMTSEQAVDLLLESCAIARGGEVLVFKMPTLAIKDLAKVMIDLLAEQYGHDPAAISIAEIGTKPGEKLYEELLSEEEIGRSRELPHLFAVLPAFRAIYNQIDYSYPKAFAGNVEEAYRSDRQQQMTALEIKTFLTDSRLLDEVVALNG